MQVAHRHVHTTRCPNIDIEHPSGHGRTRYGLYVGHPSQHAMLQESIGRRQKSESQCAERQGAGKKKVLDAKKALDLITVRENLLSCDNVFVLGKERNSFPVQDSDSHACSQAVVILPSQPFPLLQILPARKLRSPSHSIIHHLRCHSRHRINRNLRLYQTRSINPLRSINDARYNS